MKAEEIQITQPARSSEGRLYLVALIALIILLVSNLLYPETSTDLALYIGPIRVSVIGSAFLLTAPFIFFYIYKHRSSLSFKALDILFPVTMAYMTIRGIIASDSATGAALCAGFSAYALLLYYGTAVIAQKSTARKAIIYSVAGVCLIAIFLGILEFYLERNVLYDGIIKESLLPFPGQGYHRSGSTFAHPLAFGLFLIQAAPLLFIFFIGVNSRLSRVIMAAMVVLLTLALLVTFGKGPWVSAAILGLAIVIWLLWKKPGARMPVISMIIACILSVTFFSLAFHDSVSQGTFSKARKSESLSPRKYMWSRAPTVFREHPIIGVGLWQGGDKVSVVDSADLGKYTPTAIDNFYITLLIEQGLIGALLFLSTIILIFLQVVELFRGGGAYALGAVPLFISLSAGLINGMTVDSLFLWSGMIMFWLAAGMLRSLYELKSSYRYPVSIGQD